MDHQPASRGNAGRGVNNRGSGARTRFGGPRSRRRQSSGSTSRATNERAQPIKRLRCRGGSYRARPRSGSSGFVSQAEGLATGTSSRSHLVETTPSKCSATSLISKRYRKESEPNISRPRLEAQHQDDEELDQPGDGESDQSDDEEYVPPDDEESDQPDDEENVQPEDKEPNEPSEGSQQSEPTDDIDFSEEDKDALFLSFLREESHSDTDSFDDIHIENTWSTSSNLSFDEDDDQPH